MRPAMIRRSSNLYTSWMGNSEGPVLQALLLLDGVHGLQGGQPVPPGQLLALFGDVLALKGGDGDVADGMDMQLAEVGLHVPPDLLKDLLAVAHQVHLVHQHIAAADAQQGEQIGVALGLLLGPPPGRR